MLVEVSVIEKPVLPILLIFAKNVATLPWVTATFTVACTEVLDSKPRLSLATAVKAFCIPMALASGVQKA